MVGKLSFSPKKVLNKTILFDIFRVDEEKIIENLPSTSSELYVILEPGTNSFYLRREDGK